MELGGHSAEREPRSLMDEALDRFDSALTHVITTIESGGLDQLATEEKVAAWQRFETIRNKLPLVDHRLIAHAEASDLPGSYCSATMMRFLMCALQLSRAEAASRARAAAALGPRTAMLDERLESHLPKVAALQADGVVTVEKVAIVERAMATLARPGLDAEAVNTAEQLLADYAPVLEPSELKRFAMRVVDAADPDGAEPVDDQLQQDRRYVELRQRRDGMWQLRGKLTSTVGAQLTAILDPLAKPRNSAIEDENGKLTQLPDERPYVQRLHDGLDEVCGRLLKSKDQPSVGGVPASVIITIDVEDLLAKVGLAETADGSQLTSDQLLRIADRSGQPSPTGTACLLWAEVNDWRPKA